MGRGASISKYYKSFSGTDTIAFLLFPGANPITIGSLTTISYSMFRNKVPVINLGRTNINGITRGSRIYAGSMVFTLLNKHWLRELQDQVPYLHDYPTLKTDELPLFDIMIISANEYGSSVHMFIYGIDFTDEAQTVSVENLFTENTFQFVAREISVFDNFLVTESDSISSSYYSIKTGVLKNYYMNQEPLQSLKVKREPEIKSLSRSLYLIHDNNMIGEDVAMIQQLLNMATDRDIEITYSFDRYTDDAVREFQRTARLEVNGIVDNNVYTKLLEYTKTDGQGLYVQVINKSGARVYTLPDENSGVTQILPYLAQAKVLDRLEPNNEIFYKIETGYVSLYDVYNYKDKEDPFSFDILQYNSEGPQVTVLQQSLEQLYDNFSEQYTVGVFDEKTEDYVKRFQRDFDLLETGIVDYYTWNVLINNSSDNLKKLIKNHINISYTNPPGVYYTNGENISEFQNIITNNRNPQNIKYSVISEYKDGTCKTDSIIKTLTNDSIVSDVSEFESMFADDIEKGTPDDVYYFIYPYDSTPYKWHFKIKE